MVKRELLDEFIDYAKKTFGVVVIAEESSNYDTFEKIFGELPEELNIRQYRNGQIKNGYFQNNYETMKKVPVQYETSKELVWAA